MSASAPSERLAAYIGAALDALDASGLFRSTAVQLDPYGMDDLLKENLVLPAARLFLMRSRIPETASTSRDVEMTFGLALLAGRQGRASTRIASADMAAAGLAFDAMALIQADPYFGRTGCSAADIVDFRQVMSEKASQKGTAVTLVQFRATLRELIPAWPAAAALAAPSAFTDPRLTLGGTAVFPEAGGPGGAP